MQQLERFSRQYFQLHLNLDFPDDVHLRNVEFQRSLHSRLFSEDGVKMAPQARYQRRVLKALMGRIEQSIQDWEEEVCNFFRAGSSTWHI
jgi:hypothetical protein